MLILNEVDPPTEDVMNNENNVVCHWENDCLGPGSLFLTQNKLIWLNESNRRGFKLTYPAISVHAVSGGRTDDFPDPCLFLLVDTSKTDIQYTPNNEEDQQMVEDDEEEHVVNGGGNYGMEGNIVEPATNGGIDTVLVHNRIEDDDEDRAAKATAAIRFVPANHSSISDLFSTLNMCQEMNPDPNDEQQQEEQDDDSLEDCEPSSPTNSWFYTSNSRSDEILLSPEGRANLERIIGNLNDVADDELDKNHSDEK